MDDHRVGRALWVLRKRRQLRQADVAVAAGVSQSVISEIESGRLSGVTLGTMRRVFAAVDAGFEARVLWRGPALDRLVDTDHARLVGFAAERLRRYRWEPVLLETTYSIYGERGSIDLLGAMEERRAVVVEEVKTSLASIEATLRKLDEKARLVRDRLGRERFGWQPRSVGRILLLPDDTSARRAVARHAATLDLALPTRGVDVRRWLREPVGDLAGIVFIDAGSGRVVEAARQPVRSESPGYR
ncbi:MAG TPA: helix-turn-helix transcriptional regulator [Candidatus Limnocylindrales bacterium]|nr:helix-turn-helix transcriptional regulator [Candidatus Limnocylindrales bacterium]